MLPPESTIPTRGRPTSITINTAMPEMTELDLFVSVDMRKFFVA